MAHATVTVCVTEPPGRAVVDVVAAALEPFDMNGAAGAEGRWDHWQINGTARPSGGLLIRQGWENDPRVLRISQPPGGWLPGRCDGAPRGLLDFDTDRAAARRKLEMSWAEWDDIARHHPPARPIEEFLSRYDTDPAYSLDDARRDHRDQPLIQAFITARGLDAERIFFNEATDPVYRYGYDRNWYIRRLTAREIPTPELLTLDGTWTDYADFSTGMFDMAAHDRYYIAADEYLQNLPPDVHLVRVYIHC
ncbi:hypothetical protein ACFO1B_56460 [Dactylosporangium siamense]|uniref:Uncharacterized protein n=1 Tax=Dactylosporangium siamense TaxID=685454 RepID=A0A919UFR5_9ACTN|nr:hypothetical protein [Dactylosporangium siamense]GIG49885.1 hypothetical protein Dsi01nite_079260 [Dactylosporangium siamense]